MCDDAQQGSFEISEESHFEGGRVGKMIHLCVCVHTNLPQSSVGSGMAVILPGGGKRRQVG